MMLRKPLAACLLLMLAGIFAMTAGTGAVVFGQEATKEGVKDEPGKGDDSSAGGKVVYVPFRNIKEVLEKHAGIVMISYDEYVSLWKKVVELSRQSGKPPVQAVLNSASYRIVAADETAEIEAELKIRALSAGWSELLLQFGEASIGELSSESGLLLISKGQGRYTALIPKEGDHVLRLKLSARVRTSPEGRHLEFDVPSTAITRLELTVPDTDQVIEIAPRLGKPRKTEAGEGKTTLLKADLGAIDKFTALWHPRISDKPDMDVLASVTNLTSITVDNGLVHTDATMTFDILRGQLEQVRIAVPLNQRILDISSEARVKEWKVLDREKGRQLVEVTFLSRVERRAVLEVHTERVLPTEAFDVAGITPNEATGIHAVDVLRESGQVAIRVPDDLTMTLEEQQGLSRLDQSDADKKLHRAGATYFRYYSPAVRLRLVVKPVQPRLTVNHLASVIFQDDALKVVTQLTYVVERTGIFELKCQLPEGATVESVQCDHLKQFDVSSDKKQLTILLNQKTINQIHARIVMSFSLPAGGVVDRLIPLLEPLDVELETGKVQIHAADGLEVSTDIAKIVSAQPDPEPMVSQGQPGMRLASSWLFSRRPVEIPVKTTRKPTRLTAQVGTRIDVNPTMATVTSRLVYLTEFSGLDTLRLDVPESVADSAQISIVDAGSTGGLKQKTRAAAAVDGRVVWTLQLQRESIGPVVVEVTYDLPAPENEDEAASYEVVLPQAIAPFALDAARVVPLSQISGEVVITKNRELSVAAESSGGDIEAIDVRELTQVTRDGMAAFRYHKQPVKVTVKASRLEIKTVIQTIVPRSLVEVVVDREGQATYRARFVVKTSERQRLSVRVPKGELLGAQVAGRTVSLEKSEDAAGEHFEIYHINVARTQSSDETFPIMILFRRRLEPRPFDGSHSGPIVLRLPALGGKDAGNVAVQELGVAVWTPREFTLVGHPSHFTLTTPATLEGLMSRGANASQIQRMAEQWIQVPSTGVFDFPVEGHGCFYRTLGENDRLEVYWWHFAYYAWVISGALVLVAWVLRKTSWENKLTILVVGLFAAVVWSLQDIDQVTHGAAVSFFGLAFGGAIWCVQLLFGIRQTLTGEMATREVGEGGVATAEQQPNSTASADPALESVTPRDETLPPPSAASDE